MQRFFDIILSSLAILILSPILIPVMIVLRLTGEGWVFYLQKRVGLGGKTFGVYKFATMLKDSPKLGTGFITTREDPRVLPFGKFLRKTKLNEVPQLINIFLGHMSFVGPRPQVPSHFQLYSEHVREELNKIRPGLTGIGSIFFRDEESILGKNTHLSYQECYANLITPYKGELELWYVKNQSAFLYIVLIILTAWIVVFPKSKLHLKLFKDLPTPPPELLK